MWTEGSARDCHTDSRIRNGERFGRRIASPRTYAGAQVPALGIMSSTTYRAVAIINAASGADDKERMPDQVREIFQDHGIPCQVEKVTAGADISAIARAATASGAELVMAGGGDGTLRAVAEGLAGTETAMAVLPVGTLNHFARDLDVPLDFEQAVQVAASGTRVNVDVGQANGRVFINNAVIGLYPAYRSERDRREARGWGGRAA